MSRRPIGQISSAGNPRVALVWVVIALAVLLALCCGVYAVGSKLIGPKETATPVVESALVVAYSPEKEKAFTTLVERFNNLGIKDGNGEPLMVRGTPLDPGEMTDAVLQGTAGFQAMTPDSSIWLGQLDEDWSQQKGSDAMVVGETVRYAVSPVIIATWESLAREMGWPDRAISWRDLLSRAQSDPNFRWSHPSTSSASGLLATLAEFYAGANKTRGLTIEDVQSEQTLEYVAALEKTVRYYGEGNEPAIIEQALNEGSAFLDAFVVQEQMVVYYNTQQQAAAQERLVALYPVEGVLWVDHPLALLETAGLTTYQRQVFAQFRDYLLSPEAQELILSYGYRPADLSIALDGPASPLTAANGVDHTEPQTALQVPNTSVIKVVRDVWWYTKRHTNVYLVVDTSGSMQGQKLAQAQEALQSFLDQIQGDSERVGMIEFSSGVRRTVDLDELGRNRTALELEVDRLEAAGDTALLDAVYEAYQELQAFGDRERINAIVAMTDGRENNSSISLNRLVREIGRTESEGGIPVAIFCIAYGDDADLHTLQAIAEPVGGQVRQGDPETIRDLYKILSTYF